MCEGRYTLYRHRIGLAVVRARPRRPRGLTIDRVRRCVMLRPMGHTTYGETAVPWDRVVAFYRALAHTNTGFSDIAALVEDIAASPFPAAGLCALTSMTDLILGPSSVVLDNPHLIVRPDLCNRQFVLEYRDGSPAPWTRTVPVSEGYAAVVRVLTRRARWYREVEPSE
jgi:hypothetical protein